MKKTILVVVLIVVAAALIWLFARPSEPMPEEMTQTTMTEGNEDMQSEEEMGPPPQPEAGGTDEESGNEPAIETEGSVKEFAVTATSFRFSVTEMRVKRGDTVRITLTNGGGRHDWMIDEFDAGTRILDTGESQTIEFVADKTGSFEYYCSVGNHRQMGMVGTLTVEE